MEDQVIDNVKDLIDKRNRNRIILDSIQELKPSKASWFQIPLCIIIACIMSKLISWSLNTVEISSTLADVFLDVSLALLAIVLGSYAIFQALMRDEIIQELIKDKGNILKHSNRTFVNMSIMYVVDIFITMILKIICSIFEPNKYVLNVNFSNVICFLFFIIYISLNLLLVLENINFVINLYRMFNVYNIYRALDMTDSDEDK